MQYFIFLSNSNGFPIDSIRFPSACTTPPPALSANSRMTVEDYSSNSVGALFYYLCEPDYYVNRELYVSTHEK